MRIKLVVGKDYRKFVGDELVIRYPEIALSPNEIVAYIEHIVKLAKEKDLNIVIITENDVLVAKIESLLLQGELRKEDIELEGGVGFYDFGISQDYWMSVFHGMYNNFEYDE